MKTIQICMTIMFSLVLMGMCQIGRSQLAGGLSQDLKQPNDDVKEMVQNFKGEIESKTENKYKTLEPVSYRTQVVAGLNYFIKVRAVTEADKEEILHVRIYKHFKDPSTLTAVKQAETLQSPITHFD